MRTIVGMMRGWSNIATYDKKYILSLNLFGKIGFCPLCYKYRGIFEFKTVKSNCGDHGSEKKYSSMYLIMA